MLVALPRTVALLTAIACWGTVIDCAAQEGAREVQDQAQDKAADYISRIAEAGAGNRLPSVTAEFLGELSEAELATIAANKNTTAALTAKWELTRREFRSSDRIDAEHLHRFLGFVEGRLDVPLPRWWAEGVLSCERSENHPRLLRISDPQENANPSDGQGENTPWPKYQRLHASTGVGALGPSIEEAAVTESAIEFKVDGSQFRIPREEVEVYGDPGHLAMAAAIVDDEQCLVAIHNLSPSGLQVLFLQESGKPESRWNSLLRLTPTIFGGSGPAHLGQWLEIEIHESKVFVFHMSRHGFGLACLSIDEGDVEFLFSTEF